jgi:acetyl-CoA acyltransferase 1
LDLHLIFYNISLIMSSAKAKALAKHDNDVVIVAAVRSALTKGRKGGFKDTRPEELLSGVLRAAYTRARVDPALIEDIAVGNVLPPGGGASAARMAALHAGIPVTTSVNTVNRQCSSGLSAVNQIANQIIAGQIDIGIGAGVESMTFGWGGGSIPDGWSEAVLTNKQAEDCLIPMGFTSENVASDFGISRERQDNFAAKSFQKAAAAQKAGKFKDEIVPLKVKVVDPKTETATEIVVDADDGIRDGVTAEGLAKLKPSFKKDGSTHAGNASQISDGAAAVVLTRRSVAKRLGLPVVGKYVAAAVVGVPPRIMGVGPAYAIPKVLEKTGLSKDDVDFYEINEAFASQAIYSIDKIGISYDRVNVNGGAIAFGHPLGCTGARQIATGLSIAKQRNESVFVTSMCIGSGMGMAAVFVSEH